MPTYCVRWIIDIEVDTPEVAAQEALRIQRDPDSIATVFEVRDQDDDASSWHPIDAALCGVSQAGSAEFSSVVRSDKITANRVVLD
jgi:hypothetical protein